MLVSPYFVVARRAIVDARTNQLSLYDVVDGLNIEVSQLSDLPKNDNGSCTIALDPTIELIFSVRRSDNAKADSYSLELSAFLPDGAESRGRHTVQADLSTSNVSRIFVSLPNITVREDGVYTFSIGDPATETILNSTSIFVTVKEKPGESANQ